VKLPFRSQDSTRPSPKAVIPVCVFLASLALFGAMVATRPAAESTRPGPVAPAVSVVRAQSHPVRLPISASGTVEPRTESDLVTEVAGRIVWVSPQLASGGFFDEGEVLLRIDPRDYEVALEGARAALARARSDFGHAEANLGRERSMRRSGASSRARLEDAERDFARADAAVREARVRVRRAELDLERCEIRAPFAGRVREKHVDRGQYVTPGAPAARLFSVDYAEVKLPISDADLAYLDIPLATPPVVAQPEPGASQPDEAATTGSPAPAPQGPEVVLSADFAGERREWKGHVVRTEGALDSRTRMVNVVARVEDPYARTQRAAGGTPLPIGLFVEASIEGRLFEDVVELPRAALRRRDTIWVVGDDDRLEHRKVDVLRSIGDRTFIRTGLAAGERVITSALDAALDGMKVRPVEMPGGSAPSAEPTAS
jgi:RND family efflux transporter MFP subunit